MAYLFDELSEEERKKLEENQLVAGGTPTQGSASGSSLLGEGGAAALSSGQPATPSSSGWTNLRSYLDANKEQGAELAGQVASGITRTGEEARNLVRSSVSDYNARLGASSPGDINSFISDAASDPSSFASSPENVARFKALRGGIFSGPGAFTTEPNYAEIARKAAEASSLGETGQSQGGQRELIRTLNPNQTAGQLDLNQLIVSGEPSAREKISAAAQPFTGLRNELDAGAVTAEAARTKAIGDAGAVSGKINTEFVAPQTAAAKNIQKDINKRVAGFSADEASRNEAIRSLKNYFQGYDADLSPEERALFSPEGTNFDEYDENYMREEVGKTISELVNPAFATPEYIQQGVNYLTKGEKIDEVLRGAIDPLKANLSDYKNDPITKLRRSGSVGDDFLQVFFPGTQMSSGEATPATVSSPEEAARIVALQKLIEELSPFLSEEDLALAGSYMPATIGRYSPRIQDNLGPPPLNRMLPKIQNNPGPPPFSRFI